MTMDVKASQVAASSATKSSANVGAAAATGGQECAGCGKHITDRFLLKALDLFWHEDCLMCGCCGCRLGEVGSTLYTKANMILCKKDYFRMFGNKGMCAACFKDIPAFEMVMRARSNVYHLECFACQQCNHRFCVGDRFYLCENKILCEYDFEERMVFANMAYNPATLAQLKRHATHIPPSVGAGARTDIPLAVGTNGNSDRRPTSSDLPHHHGHHHHGHHLNTPSSNGHQFGSSNTTPNGDQTQLPMYDVK
ncbi:LIM domain transcription factor LMO4.1-like isoform X2 [Daktulosphaira vitifoliae]|uniref:LIM domain transcription factor LMO4.1-like isoform X2 n=1 Tax=Daktulosphaira vitifoliae TaxID=58002 RepID=UPI0021AA5BA6|nr:LIM domain transcription factor LMO4.1-like isoform X2 [Daktulosphaira vitifoliae]